MNALQPIKFQIGIIPRAQMRSNSRAVKRKNTNKYIAMTYKNTKQKNSEEQFCQVIEQFAPEVPFTCPVILGVKAFIPIPQSKPAWWKTAADQGFIRPTSTPDFDNYQKQCMDVMTQTSFWHDDSQVVGLTNDSGKFYSIKPHWEIEIIPLWQPESKKEWESNNGKQWILNQF
jgi:Holliday junction resolvase RusA-like endonuclease